MKSNQKAEVKANFRKDANKSVSDMKFTKKGGIMSNLITNLNLFS